MEVILGSHPRYKYEYFRREFAKHSKNWCFDWKTWQKLAGESRGSAILARVPAEKALEWVNWPHGPLVAVGSCGDVFLWKAAGGCRASARCKRGLQTARLACLSFFVQLFSLSLVGSTRSHPVVLG